MKSFPLFLKTTGRTVAIAGGGEQAAQKARLMLKTDARLRLVADRLDAELQALVDAGRAERAAEGAPDAFDGALLAFIATGDGDRDATLHARAKRAGCVVNVVDRPDLCDATTPSIVDRDPVVIAIGTEGTAPVLGRQIRARIEQMLEPNLGALAALAGRMRGAVAEALPAARRRAFWEGVFAGPVRAAHARGAEREAARLMKTALAGADPTPGHIALVGAGPGARDLLTLRAVQRLQEADVIFYDRLVDPEVLDLARRDARRVYVGKTVGAHDWPQDRIDALIVAEARQGQRVVRLKSGDPSLFGRAEEELRAAREAGIATEIVPGITAASAAAAALGRALTERGATDHLVLATASARAGAEAPSIASLARPGATLALYMATRQLDRIQAELLAAGWPGGTGVEAIASASTRAETVTRTTLSDMHRTLAGLPHPAIVLLRFPCAPTPALALPQSA